MRSGLPTLTDAFVGLGPRVAGRALDTVALRTGDSVVTRQDLGERIAERIAELALPTRSMVVLQGESSLEWAVTYLALLADRHVPLLAGDRAERLVESWSPAAVVRADNGGMTMDRSDVEPTPLHPDLALLMSTSGSTGNPKLVRLSHENLVSNASSIAEFLALSPDDVGITTLPLHYCFGLSVLHSHLIAGASVALTSASVVDPCFADALAEHGVTNIAGVPHTYELIEQAGPERLRVPSLRLLTQAGGRMAPQAVERWNDRACSWGAEFVVMYGQTEATARMAYLPPAIATRRPGAIGVPIPGGSFRIEPVVDPADGELTDERRHDQDDETVGELVYSGPNVMLGYACEPSDLSLGRTVEELRTGDLARFHRDDGVYEIVGRTARFVKPFGLRIDLDALQHDLSEFAETADMVVTGDDDGLVICAPGACAPALAGEAVGRTGLPSALVTVDTDSPIVRTDSGKFDFAAMMRCARATTRTTTGNPDPGPTPHDAASIAAVFATVLGRSDVKPSDTFVSLGGDSLSYIECSFRLEAVLGRLPPDWHLLPIGRLSPRRRRRHVVAVDTTVLLRVAGIFAIVATHMGLRFTPGGAHLMLAVVGYNLSRFLLPIEHGRARLAAGLRTAGRVAVPTVLWVAAGLALGANFGVGTLLLVNNYVGPRSHAGDEWHFWFIEIFVHVTLLITFVSLVAPVRRFERRRPYLTALVALGLLLLLRLDWAWMNDWYNLRFRTHGVAWFVALGWLLHQSDTRAKRLFTTALVVATVWGFFDYAPREVFVIGGLLVLVAAREVVLPRRFAQLMVVLASASMWIYITHFTFWPPLVDALGVRLAYVPTIMLGVAAWAVAERLTRLVVHQWTHRQVGLARHDVRIA